MKSIMLSIRSEWFEKILNGEKTIEIRKTMPKCELPVKVYIYCTKNKPYLYRIDDDNNFELTNKLRFPEDCFVKDYNAQNGKVVAEFVLKEIDSLVSHQEARFDTWNFKDRDALDKCLKDSCLSMEKIVDYIGDSKDAYAWHISNLKIYDKPKELIEFSQPFAKECKMCVSYTRKHICGCGIANKCLVLTRPPQSWCYVEDLGGEDE